MTRRGVSFNKRVRVRLHIHRSGMTDDEIQSTWYTADELTRKSKNKMRIESDEACREVAYTPKTLITALKIVQDDDGGDGKLQVEEEPALFPIQRMRGPVLPNISSLKSMFSSRRIISKRKWLQANMGGAQKRSPRHRDNDIPWIAEQVPDLIFGSKAIFVVDESTANL